MNFLKTVITLLFLTVVSGCTTQTYTSLRTNDKEPIIQVSLVRDNLDSTVNLWIVEFQSPSEGNWAVAIDTKRESWNVVRADDKGEPVDVPMKKTNESQIPIKVNKAQ